MAKPKLTPWFPGRIKPARPGVYLASVLLREDLDDHRGLYRFWNGKHWCKPGQTIAEAMEPSRLRRAIFRVQHWRGRAIPPRTTGAQPQEYQP